jgi:hypothetical protein
MHADTAELRHVREHHLNGDPADARREGDALAVITRSSS